jgi:hypothetical protein
MAPPGPPTGFVSSTLDLADVPAGARFGRIYLSRYPDPLGIGKTPSRFSDSRRRSEANRFGVLYLGETLKVCFLEAILRDRRDGETEDLPIAETELAARSYAEVEVAQPLRLIDLRGDAAIRMGVPSDVARSSQQSVARKWSVAFHEHATQVDGIIYPSRLNTQTNLAIYDRSIPKLRAARTVDLLRAPGLGRVLDDLKVALV